MKRITILLLALLLLFVAVVPVFAYDNIVTYRGQGIYKDDDGSYLLETELCNKVNGAEVDGPYLLWVLTATGASHADLLFPGITEPVAMRQAGNHGAFKYVTHWMDLSTLPGNVVATYDGEPKNVQLVISHGCRPKQEKSAWCSPGYWGQNVDKGAWSVLNGAYKPEDLFNSTVYDAYYGATFVENPSLLTVLTTNGGTYKGPGVPGTAGYNLNAFNAVGAMLTEAVPGYTFDPALMGASDACPVDAFGHFKNNLVSDFPSEGYAPAYVFIPAVVR